MLVGNFWSPGPSPGPVSVGSIAVGTFREILDPGPLSSKLIFQQKGMEPGWEIYLQFCRAYD